MKRTYLAGLCLLFFVTTKAQLTKIALPLSAKQSFRLIKSEATSTGYTFTGVLRTAESYVTVDSIAEIFTTKEFAVTDIKKAALSQNENLALYTPETQAKYASLFNLPSYYGSNGHQVKVGFGSGLNMKQLDNSFEVTPVLYKYNNLKLDYDYQTQPPAKFALSTTFGNNIKEETGAGSIPQLTKGNYGSVFGIYLDRGNDEGMWNRKYYFFRFSPKAELQGADSVVFPVKRYFYSNEVVINSNNEYKGMIYLFTARSAINRKVSDSTDIQYDLFYFDETGKKRYQTTFYFGAKKFSLVPVTVLEENGALEIMNQHYNDSLLTFRFAADGKLENITGTAMIKKDIIKARPTLVPFFDWFVSYAPVYTYVNKAGERYWLLRRYTQNAAQMGVFADSYTFTSYAYFKVKTDKTVELLQMFTDVNGNSPVNGIPECTLIQKNDVFCDILVRNPQTDKKVIWRLGDPKIPDVANGVNPPGILRTNAASFIKISENEYYVTGYTAREILLNKVTMELSK
jgi:hypothetical protein